MGLQTWSLEYASLMGPRTVIGTTAREDVCGLYLDFIKFGSSMLPTGTRTTDCTTVPRSVVRATARGTFRGRHMVIPPLHLLKAQHCFTFTSSTTDRNEGHDP
uniref:Uncharacterized protein n=1 Tax=Solanum tuberosum TaxID=4113 RepID=M1D980_SOLTU